MSTVAKPTPGSRVFTSTWLYSAAIFAVGMAVPHFAIGLAAHWPGQLMSAHVLVIALLVFFGLRAEQAERARLAPHKGKAKKPTRREPGDWDAAAQRLLDT